jgi:hypothetical protein
MQWPAATATVFAPPAVVPFTISRRSPVARQRSLLDNHAGTVCGPVNFEERGKLVFAKERNPIERLLQISALRASAVASAGAPPNCEVKVRVVDPMGDIAPEATVKIAKAADGEEVSRDTSNNQGEFNDRIAPGIYSLQVEYGGLVSFQQKLTCKASETVSVKAPLRLAAMGEAVEVKSEGSPLLRKLRSLFRRL